MADLNIDVGTRPNELGINLGVGTVMGVYTAGEGIWIEDHVINADVTQPELDALAGRVGTLESTAKTAASDAATAKTNASSAVSTANAAKSTVDSMKLGGRNLALGTALKTSASEMREISATGDADLSHHVRWYNGSSSKHAFSRYSDAAWMDTVSVDANAGNVGIGFFREASETGLSAGDSYTLSWWAKTSAPGMKLWKGLAWFSSSGKWTWVGGQNPVASTGEWQHMTYTGTFPSDAVFILPSFGVVAGSSASVLYLRECKMEAGNRATGWTPAPEDTDSAVKDAKKAGTDAQTSADRAQSTADDAWARTLRVQVSSAPADAAGDTSTLTATVWRGGELLSDEAVAMMGLVAWYVGGSRVATGSTYTCAAGTAAECRLEA